MKKFVALFLMLTCLVTSSVYAQDINVRMEKEESVLVALDETTKVSSVTYINGQTYVGAREIATMMGSNFAYDSKTSEMTYSNSKSKLTVNAKSGLSKLDGKEVELSKAVLLDGVNHLNIAEVCDKFGYTPIYAMNLIGVREKVLDDNDVDYTKDTLLEDTYGGLATILDFNSKNSTYETECIEEDYFRFLSYIGINYQLEIETSQLILEVATNSNITEERIKDIAEGIEFNKCFQYYIDRLLDNSLLKDFKGTYLEKEANAIREKQKSKLYKYRKATMSYMELKNEILVNSNTVGEVLSKASNKNTELYFSTFDSHIPNVKQNIWLTLEGGHPLQNSIFN